MSAAQRRVGVTCAKAGARNQCSQSVTLTPFYSRNRRGVKQHGSSMHVEERLYKYSNGERECECDCDRRDDRQQQPEIPSRCNSRLRNFDSLSQLLQKARLAPGTHVNAAMRDHVVNVA